MKKITTEVKDRVLVFFGKGHKFISSKQELAFVEESNTSARGITIDGDFVNFSSVAKIISLNDFYNENPDLRPHRPEMMSVFTRNDFKIRKFDKYSTKNLELMREGIKNYIDNSEKISWKEWHGEGKRPAQDILEKMDKRIAELKEESDKQRLSL